MTEQVLQLNPVRWKVGNLTNKEAKHRWHFYYLHDLTIFIVVLDYQSKANVMMQASVAHKMPFLKNRQADQSLWKGP